VKSWLHKRGHEVNETPLRADAASNLADCLAIDDQGCARGVIEKISANDSLIYAYVQNTGKRAVSVQMYWFTRGHEGASEKRGCEKCTDEDLDATLDDMLVALAKSSEVTGRLILRSRPEDLVALVDNNQVGQTPLERDLPAGKHKIVIMQGGERVGDGTVQIVAGETTKLTLTARSDESYVQKVGSVALITAGFGLLVTAGVMISYGSKDGPNEMYVYDNATGIGLICGGVGLLGVVGGALLWPRSTQRTVPVASVGPAGAYVGFAGRF
jgi:hypothetical protein